MLYQVQLEIENSFGKFKGNTFILNEEDYEKLKDMTRTFYSMGGFELTCEDNTFIIFPPEIVKVSILKIHTKEIKKEDDEQI